MQPSSPIFHSIFRIFSYDDQPICKSKLVPRSYSILLTQKINPIEIVDSFYTKNAHPTQQVTQPALPTSVVIASIGIGFFSPGQKAIILFFPSELVDNNIDFAISLTLLSSR